MKNIGKAVLLSAVCFGIMLATPTQAQAEVTYVDYKIDGIGLVSSSNYMIKAQASGVLIREAANGTAGPIATAAKGLIYPVLEVDSQGFAKIEVNGRYGYIDTKDSVILYESVESDVDEEMQVRQNIVSLALSHVGGRYVWGGGNPKTGFDCSGFTRYAIGTNTGKWLSHSSKAQANEGRQVSESELKPGDLVFYAGSSGIDHVALYIGNGKVVHASSESTGIRVSNYTYRKPVRFVSAF